MDKDDRKVKIINSNEQWKRAFTNKRYIHPPLSERIFTMWPDMKILCGDEVEKTSGFRSSAFRILIGEDMVPPVFSEVKYYTRTDGIPIHKIGYGFDEFDITMESFCDIERNPVCYSKIDITSKVGYIIKERISILPRTGCETYLTGMEVDGYAHYDSNVYNWGYIPSNWNMIDKNLISDGEYNLYLKTENNVSTIWQGDESGLDWYQRRTLCLDFELNPFATKTIYCSFAKKDLSDFDYSKEREKVKGFWLGELKKLKKVPGGDRYRDMINNLVCQCLQMFAYPIEKDYVLPRQGGLQRAVWPAEAIEFLMALDRFGDYYSYTEKAYETFFFVLQCKEGENKGAVQNLFGVAWGSITGAACWGCAKHILYRKDKNIFDKFKENLWLAFCWMQKQRRVTVDRSYVGVGIFPPMQSCDWPEIGQSWCQTDATNLIGYQFLAEVFKKFNDPRAEEIQNAYDDYMACMKKILNEEVKKNMREDELFIPNKVGQASTDPPSGAYFTDGPAILLRAGVIESGSEIAQKVENWFRNRNQMKNGLTGRMNTGLMASAARMSDPWAGHTWYTSYSDLYWFYNWLDSGEIEKARETLVAQMKWGMTKEYYMLERYADNDPYYTPWLPNASANGRFMMMLEDYFQKVK